MSTDLSTPPHIGDVTRIIKGVATAQFIVALLLGIAGLLICNYGVRAWFAPAAPQASQHLRDPLSTIGIGCLCLYGTFLLSWLHALGKFLRRNLRPVGVCISAWLALKFTAGTVFMILVGSLLGDLKFQYQGKTLFLRDALGTILYSVSAIIIILAICMVALFFFYRSRRVEAALERADGARYWTDDVPLPVLFGAWLFFSLALSTISRLYDLDIQIWLGPLSDGLKLPLLLGLCALLLYLAWGFCRRRIFVWYLALAVSPLWLATQCMTSFELNESDLLRMKDLPFPTQDFLDLLNRFVPIVNWIVAIQFTAFLVYLVLIKRYFRPVGLPRDVASIGIHADPASFWRLIGKFKAVLFFIPLMLFLHQYFLMLTFLVGPIFMLVYGMIFEYLPAVVFDSDGVTLRNWGLFIPPRYPYDRLKSVQLRTTWARDTKLYDPQERQLNLSASIFRDAELAQLKAAFEAHGIAISYD